MAVDAHYVIMKMSVLLSVRAHWLPLKPAPCGAVTGPDFLSHRPVLQTQADININISVQSLTGSSTMDVSVLWTNELSENSLCLENNHCVMKTQVVEIY